MLSTEIEFEHKTRGVPPKRFPQFEKECLTAEQANEVYECIEKGTELTAVTGETHIEFDSSLVQASECHEEAFCTEEVDTSEDLLQSDSQDYSFDMGAHMSEEIRPEYQILDQLPQVTLAEDYSEYFSARFAHQWTIMSPNPLYLIPEKDTNPLRTREARHPERYSHLDQISRQVKVVNNIQMTCEEYLDRYDAIKPVTNKHPDWKEVGIDHAVAMTYMGRHREPWHLKWEVEPSFRIDRSCEAIGQLLSGSHLNLFCDSGATRCYLRTGYFEEHPELHNLPRYKTTSSGIYQGGEGAAKIECHFIIPVDFIVQGHRFEVFALVCDISSSHDLIIGIQNMFELEGELSARKGRFSWLNRSLPLLINQDLTLHPGQSQDVVVHVPFMERIEGKCTVKLYVPDGTGTLNLHFQDNKACMNLENNGPETMCYGANRPIGIADLRSLGYFKVTQSQIMNELKDDYNFIEAREACDRYNKLIEVWDELKQAQEKAKKEELDPFPWLEAEDERRFLTDEQIIRKFVKLEESCLSDPEKEKLRVLMCKYKKAFSLRDEIGECPNMKIDIELRDDEPFFVKPFPIAEKDKPFMDKQMKRLVHLGIISENTSTSCTSPVMLITRKLTNDKRPVVDFRQLNTRIVRRNTATPLMRDILHILGGSKCEVLSCLDLKDAYHSIPLTEKSKEYCGIIPYYGSQSYRYNVLPMGLSISPARWMEYVNVLLGTLEHKNKFLAIMDDLLVHSKKAQHWELLEELFKALIKHGLKLSPKKCQLFRKALVYMGSHFRVSDEGMQVTPLKTRVEAMERTPIPRNAKEVKSFCGVANYLAVFLPELQLLLRPLYNLVKKNTPFVWTQLHTDAFNEIKKRLTKYPILYCPTPEGRYVLYSDTSRKHAGSALWQIQDDGEQRLIGYASKTLPEACKNYSVTELEMFGMVQNMKSWKWFLGHNEFDCVVDHKAVVSIMVAKAPNATDRIGVLLHKLMEFCFKLHYLKGKDLIIADWLSRTKTDTTHPDIVVPVSFCPREIVCQIHNQKLDEFSALLERKREELMVTTRRQAAQAGEKPPEVHGANKAVNTSVKPEHDRELIKQVEMPKSILKKPSVERRMAPSVGAPSAAQAASKKLIKKSVEFLKKRINRVTFQPNKNTVAEIPQIDKRLRQKTKPRNPNLLPPAKVCERKRNPNPGPPPPDPALWKPRTGPPPLKDPWEIDFEAERRKRLDGPRPESPAKSVEEEFGPDDPLRKLLQRRKDESQTEAETEISPETERRNLCPWQDLTETILDSAPEKPSERPVRNISSNFDTDPLTDLGNPENFEEDGYDIGRPKMTEFHKFPSWSDRLREESVMADNLPTQADVEGLLKHLEQKVLRHTHLPLSYRDMEAAYMNCPQFKDIFLFLSKGILPKNKNSANKVMNNSDRYMLWGPVLHLIYQDKQGNWGGKPCIPPSKVDQLLQEYHSSCKGGHQGVTKVYKMLSERYHIPNLAKHVQAYIIGCNLCELFRDREKKRPFMKRVNLNVPAMSKISMDIKFMPPGKHGYKYILVMICEVSNYIVAAPLRDRRAEDVTQAFFENFVVHYGIPTHVIMDQDRAFTSNAFQEMMREIGTKVLWVSVTNHKSLKAEHGIKSLSNILTKYLTGKGREWPEMVGVAQLNYNTFASPNLDGFSPFELVYAHRAKIVPELEIEPQLPRSGPIRVFYQNLKHKIDSLRQHMQKYRDQKVEMQNKDREPHSFQVGQLVHMFQPRGAFLNTGSRKIRCKYVGPLVIFKAISQNQFLLMTIDGMIYPHLVEETRLKPITLHSSMGPISTLAQLKRVYNQKIRIDKD